MRKYLPILVLLIFVIGMYGCDKEKIVTTTEIIKEVEYVEIPPDTVFVTDTVQSVVDQTDTLIIHDTLFQTNTIYDTVVVTEQITDTVIQVQNNYDTVTVTVTVVDTVEVTNNTPNEYYAYSAMQYHSDPAVIEFINADYGYTDGWILYLSSFMNEVSSPSAGVYDFYGTIDYWTPDWSGYLPIEYGWRLSYSGGDPSNPQNWQMSSPPGAVDGKSGGIKITTDLKLIQSER